MAVYNVATAAELTATISKLTGGDTVLLAAGNYGNVGFYLKNYATTVTVAAAPGAGKVHFDGLSVASSSNLTFSGLDLGRALAAGEPEYTKINTIQDSKNVKLVNVTIHGSQDGNVNNDAIGLFVTHSERVEVLSSRFDELYRGILMQRSTDVTISGSRFEEIRSDGINSAASDRVTIRGNTFKAFNRFDVDHADAIQFWNVGQTKGATDIVIRDNVFLPTESGTGAQGILIGDGEVHGYTNVLIQNNLLYGNDDYHGITVSHAKNLKVLGNTTLSSASDSKNYWIRLEASENVTVKNNVSDHLFVLADNVGVVNENNLVLNGNPAARSRFLDLESPSSVFDLMTPGIGYQLPDRGMVSKALGSTLSGAINKGLGLKLSSEVTLRDLDLSSTAAELTFETGRTTAQISSAPVLATVDLLPAPVPQTVYERPAAPQLSWSSFDHFVALP